MSDVQAIADRVEIEALRGEVTDTAMMRHRARLASLFTHDGALRMPRHASPQPTAQAPNRTPARAGQIRDGAVRGASDEQHHQTTPAWR